MSYAITVQYALQATVRETLADGVPAAASPTIVHAGFNSAGVLSSTTTPPVTKMAAFAKALVANAATINLAALVGTAGVTVDGTGLKVQLLKVENPSTNTGALTITPGASNGYNILGATSKIVLNPGEQFLWLGDDSASVPDVAAGAKNIDLAGTGTESSNWLVVLG